MPERIPCARRAIDLRASGRSVVAWLEDDFHHFGIELRHDGEKVIAVDGQAARFPRPPRASKVCSGVMSRWTMPWSWAN